MNDAEQDDRLPLLRPAMFEKDLASGLKSPSLLSPMSLVMVDLDHFKQVNDQHGHPVGNEVLFQTASILRQVLGGRGTAYRYGGFPGFLRSTGLLPL
jgi:diguanylate cyclase (GGDEF)-like protein